MADNNQLQPRPREGDVELAVDGRTVYRLRRGEQLQLIGIADGGAKKDVVALAALKALHCVDSDVLTAREVAGSQATAHGGNLTAEGNNHTDLGGWIERQAAACIQAIKRFNQSRYHFGLGGIDFVVFGRQSRHDVDKARRADATARIRASSDGANGK